MIRETPMADVGGVQERVHPGSLGWSSKSAVSQPGFRRHHPPGAPMYAESRAMRRVLDLARRVAPFDTNVLIVGESGVGKERLARFIHDHSKRTDGPFVAINCGAVPEGLFESEFFGHARGAFTGAVQDRAGVLESANRGTLLLDEVGELTLPMQVKLLRALQEREIRRVGDNHHRQLDVRVLAATNRNLDEAVRHGRFRSDLLYRMNVVELAIPPLRERPEDMERIAHAALERIARRYSCGVTGFTDAALALILQHEWPGNVRQLENAIERACTLASGSLIDVADLPASLRMAAATLHLPGAVRPLRDVEREYIIAALHRNKGNRTLTAAQLGIGTRTLFRKLNQYDQMRPGNG